MACESSLHNAYGLSRHGAPLRYVCGAAATVRVRSHRKMFGIFYFFLQLSSPFTPVFYSQLINYIMYGKARPYDIYNNKVLNDNFVSMTP